MAGYPIIHCINQGIEKSRRIIFILSRYFQSICLSSAIGIDIQILEHNQRVYVVVPGISLRPSGEWKNLLLLMLKL